MMCLVAGMIELFMLGLVMFMIYFILEFSYAIA